jgi:hypothetical protein
MRNNPAVVKVGGVHAGSLVFHRPCPAKIGIRHLFVDKWVCSVKIAQRSQYFRANHPETIERLAIARQSIAVNWHRMSIIRPSLLVNRVLSAAKCNAESRDGIVVLIVH